MATRLPAEWEKQDCIVLAWPTMKTDWNENLKEVVKTYIRIIEEIADHELVLLIASNSKVVYHSNQKVRKNISIIIAPYNDTWTRDYVGMSINQGNKNFLMNFKFNAWGNKFEFTLDNGINSEIESKGLLSNQLKSIPFILEGGSIESNGSVTLLTTSNCLLNTNRNPLLSKGQIENVLKTSFGSKSIIWLNYGHIQGDDTDSHVDNLARFCNEHTIAYAIDASNELIALEKELKKKIDSEKFNLIPIPLPNPIIFKNRILPASYLNFLITNKKVLIPIFKDKNDSLVLEIFKNIFVGREVVGIDCNALVKQNGSLHCITMQLSKGILCEKLYEKRN